MIKNIDIMTQQLEELARNWVGHNDEDVWWESETGGSLTEYIACPYTSWRDCLAEQRECEYGTSEWDWQCHECKAKWLMSETEGW